MLSLYLKRTPSKPLTAPTHTVQKMSHVKCSLVWLNGIKVKRIDHMQNTCAARNVNNVGNKMSRKFSYLMAWHLPRMRIAARPKYLLHKDTPQNKQKTLMNDRNFISIAVSQSMIALHFDENQREFVIKSSRETNIHLKLKCARWEDASKICLKLNPLLRTNCKLRINVQQPSKITVGKL